MSKTIDEETLCGVNAVLSEIDHSLQLVDDDFNKSALEAFPILESSAAVIVIYLNEYVFPL